MSVTAIGRYDVVMTTRALIDRARRLDPLVLDIAMAVTLAVLVCAQIWFVTHWHPSTMPIPPGARFRVRVQQDFGFVPYVVAACAFLPLATRRSVPWLALLLSGAAASVYTMQPFPPAFTTFGPMIALYSLAAYAKRRHMGVIALLVVGLVLAVPIFAFSGDVRWVGETVGTITLLIAATLLGDAARNRREYVAEVEKRAFEAERTREEEALRRVDEERMRIAREVHDIVAHSLSIVTVQAAAAEAVLDTDPAQSRESIRHIRNTSRQALGELRSMLDVLRTGEATESPLAPAFDLSHIEQLVAPLRESGLTIDLEVTGDLGAVPAYASVSAYRLVQESLTNVVRHSGATSVRVRISASESEVGIDVSDNGNGAPPNALLSGGHGIRGMRERVDALGGTFSAGALGAQGFGVSAAIPLPRSGS
ncbi:MAG TPA: sensor histidine kinase [Coriobacteriia bacterium]|nr:sensor histidine kinase [Coriobacteriia bacterium]